MVEHGGRFAVLLSVGAPSQCLADDTWTSSFVTSKHFERPFPELWNISKLRRIIDELVI